MFNEVYAFYLQLVKFCSKLDILDLYPSENIKYITFRKAEDVSFYFLSRLKVVVVLIKYLGHCLVLVPIFLWHFNFVLYFEKAQLLKEHEQPSGKRCFLNSEISFISFQCSIKLALRDFPNTLNFATTDNPMLFSSCFFLIIFNDLMNCETCVPYINLIYKRPLSLRYNPCSNGQYSILFFMIINLLVHNNLQLLEFSNSLNYSPTTYSI